MTTATFDPLQALRDELADPTDIRPLPADECAAAADLTLGEFYAQVMTPWREARIAAGTVKPDSIRKEAQNLRTYERWDREPTRRPVAWPADREWRGLPLGLVSRVWIERFLLTKVEEGWAEETTFSCWVSIRTALNHARNLGVIAHTPRMYHLRTAIRDLQGDDAPPRKVRPYTDEQLGALYAAVDEVVLGAIADGTVPCRTRRRFTATAAKYSLQLKGAFVVGANCGPRPRDLFSLRFDRHVRLDETPPLLAFRSSKVKKAHRIPLADVTTAHLAALRSLSRKSGSPFVFPDFAPTAATHRDCTRRQRATALLRRLITAVGLDESDYRWPWHSLRKSCTTRFTILGLQHGWGPVGRIITHGKDADVASQSYFDESHVLGQAIATISWPAEFRAGLPPLPADDPSATQPAEVKPRRTDWAFHPRGVSYRGHEMRIAMKPLGVLRLLISANRAVTAREILDTVWPRQQRTIIVVKTTIAGLRELLKAELHLPPDCNPIPNAGDGAGWRLVLPDIEETP